MKSLWIAVLAALFGSAQAAMVELTTTDDLSSLTPGETFQVTLALSDDFPDVTGGGFDLFFSDTLTFVSGTLAPGLAGSLAPSAPTAAGPGTLSVANLSFADLLGPFFGTSLPGGTVIGSLTFEASSAGAFEVTLGDVSSAGFAFRLESLTMPTVFVTDVDYGVLNGEVADVTGEIPLPAAAFLFLGGGAVFAAARRQRS